MDALPAFDTTPRRDDSFMHSSDVFQIYRQMAGGGDHTDDERAAASARARIRDRALADRVRDGDWEAFRSLFSSHHDALYRFAMYHARSADAADDLVQDVFAAVWHRRASFTITSSLRAYLIRALRNRILNAARHAATEQEASVRAQGHGVSFAMGTPEPSPDIAHDTAELQERMIAAMASLPARQREVMLLRWRNEMAPREIAEALGISEQVVRRQLAAAADKLRRVFVREDFRR